MADWMIPEIFDSLSPEERALALQIGAEIERGIDPRELRRRGPDGLAEITVGALALLRTLRPDEARVRVQNPGGHRAGRTVIEVASRDCPFLVDTLRLALRRFDLRERLLLHPLLGVERDAEGHLKRVEKEAAGIPSESYMYAEVALVRDRARRRALEQELQRVNADVRRVVSDHGRMVKALRRHVADLECARSVIQGGPARAQRLIEFLEWLADDHYIFLGYRYYSVSRTNGSWSVVVSPESGLGTLRDASVSRFKTQKSGSEIPDLIRTRLADKRLVFFDKSSSDSSIHRSGKIDCISVKAMDPGGRVVGFGQFVGLLTHRALHTRGSDIAMLRERRSRVLEIVGAEPGSHTYKAAEEAYDGLPVEVLFQFAISDVARAVERILTVTDHGHLGVYLLPDPLSRSFFVSVIIPRARYDEDLRRDLEGLLRTRYGVSYTDSRVRFLDDEVALIHYFCSVTDEVDVGALQNLERDIESLVARWEEGLEAGLLASYPEERAYALVDEYGEAFPEPYRVVTQGTSAVRDIEALESLRSGAASLVLDLQPESDAGLTRLKVYQSSRPYLTDLLPKLDHFGLRVLDATLTEVKPASSDSRWVVTFRVEGLEAVDEKRRARLLDALHQTLSGSVSDDRLHRLVLEAALHWREVDLLRAYLAYARQIGTSPGTRFASDVLASYPAAAQALVRLFRARFDPDTPEPRSEAEAAALHALEQARGLVPTAAEDRVFGLIANLVQSTTRTSYFAPSGDEEPLVALKIDSAHVERMPAPRPWAEIFVHSASMSGIHLRGGPVARGGIRWSDRTADFRTEVLGLMKTQMVKNGLIVPIGSKGGFALKRRISDPKAAAQEGERQYTRYVRALFSLTDNRDGECVAPPQWVVRHDGDDPYLVVAPDKGTARFSDLANRVAEESGFWLGDAFASGGSEGYDHKREGITARGAWVCVKRHFTELGLDVDRDPFTAVGIGDMAGDVFGNGMLLARRAKLLAAFNHRHIFLDPDPDPERAWEERKRLFDLPASSWQDYDPARISEGGGVFERSAKEIRLSAEAQEMLGVDEAGLSGEELIRAVLRSPVDLLWNGGIGTYVKGFEESHADVGDRANDAVRVDARDVRARVVGEGGNLGFTSRARVEFARAGGRINTDAVDNSGGVDLSDHEVNFKILLAPACRSGVLTRGARRRVLGDCLGEAVDSVLSNNAGQSLCLSIDELRAREDPEAFLRATEFLARDGGLDPELERLPGVKEVQARVASRAGPVYTRPELALLLGFTKLLAKRSVLASDCPDLPVFHRLLQGYFPRPLGERFSEEIERHPLRREITTAVLVNRVVDRAGSGMLPRLVEGLGVDVADAIAAYELAGVLLDSDPLRATIFAEAIPEETRIGALRCVERSVRRAARQLLGLERSLPRTDDALESWRQGRQELREQLPELPGPGPERAAGTAGGLRREGLSAPLAEELSWLPSIVRTLPAVPLVDQLGSSLEEVVAVWGRIGDANRMEELLVRLEAETRRGGWDRLAAEALSLEVLQLQRALTVAALSSERGVEAFVGENRPAFDRVAATVERLEGTEGPVLPAVTLLVQQLRRLC